MKHQVREGVRCPGGDRPRMGTECELSDLSQGPGKPTKTLGNIRAVRIGCDIIPACSYSFREEG